MVELLPFIVKFKYIIIFYLVVIALVYIYRKRIDVQAKIIFLFRMKWGLGWMDKYGKKYREWIILLGYIGTGLGFISMIITTSALLYNLVQLMINPVAQPGVGLVLPGLSVPGFGVIPFWHWLIAIFMIALVHEFAHGVVARAHDIKVKNTGIVLLGPILGAFVEPDEKSLRKKSDVTQYSVLAAGAFANVILAVVAILILNLAIIPGSVALEDKIIDPLGMSFESYVSDDLPFAKAGIMPKSVITGLNDVKTNTAADFMQEVFKFKSGDKVSIIADGKSYEVTLAEHPDASSRPYLGILNAKTEGVVKEEYNNIWYTGLYSVLVWLKSFLLLLYILSFGIGLFNLLPLPIVDGGRMAQVFLHKLKGAEKGEMRYRKISLFLLLVLVLNLVYPWLLKLF